MNIYKILDDFKKINLESLDVQKIGSWPSIIFCTIYTIIFLIIISIGYNFYIKRIVFNMELLQVQEQVLKDQVSLKAFQVANLEPYRQQMEEMQKSFDVLLKQLPADTEVPGLLEDITRIGLTSGLEFTEIKLMKEVQHQFYVELPIQIAVQGGYHEMANFVSAVSNLPRIVTLHDLDLSRRNEGDSASLKLNILAKTYRYSEQAPESHD